jgi:hypothetical protein
MLRPYISEGKKHINIEEKLQRSGGELGRKKNINKHM